MAKKKKTKTKKWWGLLKNQDKKRGVAKATKLHNSFKLSKKRDYHVNLPLPGYMDFTVSVFRLLKNNKNTFLLLILVGVVLGVTTASTLAQGRYIEIVANLRESIFALRGEPLTLMGETASIIGALFFAGIGGNAINANNPYPYLIALLLWLTSVWLVRNIKAGKSVTLREGLYNSGAPIISTGLIATVTAVQLAPAMVAVGVYVSSANNGFLENGAVAMALGLAVFFVILLCVYWLTATLLALIIITLPNTYPLQALRLAANLASGIRLRILYRVLWILAVIAFFWLIVLGGVVAIETVLRVTFEWFINVPLVPAVVLVLLSSTVVFLSTALYLLYIDLVEAKYERTK